MKIIDSPEEVRFNFTPDGENLTAKPVLSFQDKNETTFHIIKDDHCYLILVPNYQSCTIWFGTYTVSSHIFKDAFEALKTLSIPD